MKQVTSVPLALPILRDRQPKRESVRVRVSAKEKRALHARAKALGCSVTELLLGVIMEHGDKIVVIDR
tara:strand:- start:21945 stop:22148 length:204 start_codon:yes stop_codon:yes gene_type:complete